MTDHDHERGGIDAAEEAAGIDPAEMTLDELREEIRDIDYEQIGRAHV